MPSGLNDITCVISQEVRRLKKEPILSSRQDASWFLNAYVCKAKTTKIQVLLAWEPPETGVLKLNVDGSQKNGSGAIGAWGVIRDSFGDWMVLEAELWGLFFVLEVAVGKGISKIIVEMDSATAAVHLIQQLVLDTLHPLAGIVASCVADGLTN
ncbi:unnamed protein product [Prunus armeniaca]